MRVAIGGIYHESNTFHPEPMTAQKFAEQALHEGVDILRFWRGTCSEINGFLEAAGRFDFEIVPTLMAWGWPLGTVTSEAFEYLAGRLTTLLKSAGELDGILLSLHGAMVSEHYLDADAEILRRVRDHAGPKVPIVATLDYHANLTEDMVRYADALVGYDTYPHVDQIERGFEAADIMRWIVREGLRPALALVRRPFLPHILSQLTERPPMADAIAMAHELERQPGMVSISVTAGFPYTDVPDAGFAVVAVAREDVGLAREMAGKICDFVWSHRSEFNVPIPTPEEAVAQAMETKEGLVVLADVGDNVGAGTPGDGTVLLEELLRQGATGALVMLADSVAVAQCLATGVRQRVELTVGGGTDSYHGKPVQIKGVVKALTDGVFQNIGPMRDGIYDDQGRTAVVESGGVVVVLTERRLPMWNLQQLRALGIEPTRLRIIVVKSAIAYRAAYAPVASRIIEVDTPGLSAADVRRFSYKRLKRPVYPLDDI